jgi:hypothetical protein
MVFAVNCGQDGSPNSFTNFKQAALAFGAAQSSALPSATPGASAAAPADDGWTTAAYGGYTIPIILFLDPQIPLLFPLKVQSTLSRLVGPVLSLSALRASKPNLVISWSSSCKFQQRLPFLKLI